jgi:hypothetical protein
VGTRSAPWRWRGEGEAGAASGFIISSRGNSNTIEEDTMGPVGVKDLGDSRAKQDVMMDGLEVSLVTKNISKARCYCSFSTIMVTGLILDRAKRTVRKLGILGSGYLHANRC